MIEYSSVGILHVGFSLILWGEWSQPTYIPVIISPSENIGLFDFKIFDTAKFVIGLPSSKGGVYDLICGARIRPR